MPRKVWPIFALLTLVFLAIAPTLTRLEFYSGSENLNVATVVEMRRGGPWLVPTLKGNPRYTKPPLPAWVTAGLVPAATIDALAADPKVVDESAYRALAWQVRWPALLLSCLMLLAVWDLGRTCGDARVGLLAAMVCASNLLFLDFGRFATTDVHLAFWVSVSMAALARAVILRQYWAGLLVAGAALGLANMSKGPVALVQAGVPVAVFCFVRGYWQKATGDRELATGDLRLGSESNLQSPIFLPVLCGVALMLAIALPWPVAVLTEKPDLLGHWWSEISREGATNLTRDPFYSYLLLLPRMLPWLAFFVAGTLMACGLDARRDPRRLLPLLLTFVPIVVMSFVKDKPDRYLLPMVGPASVLAAYAVAEQFKSRFNRTDIALSILHWLALGAASVAFIWVATVGIAGERWYEGSFAVMSSTGLIVLIVGGICVSLWRGWALPITTLAAMLIMQVIFIDGYRRTESGRSEMKPLAALIRAERPAADVYYFDPSKSKAMPVDLNIYLAKVVRSVSDPEKVPANGVLVILQRKGEPEPRPHGFVFIGKAPAPKGRFWHALERRSLIGFADRGSENGFFDLHAPLCTLQSVPRFPSEAR